MTAICLCSSSINPHVHSGPDGAAEPLGWIVKDAQGNVIESGPLVYAEPAFSAGEESDNGGEK